VKMRAKIDEGRLIPDNGSELVDRRPQSVRAGLATRNVEEGIAYVQDFSRG
jgi:hypothetical protein